MTIWRGKTLTGASGLQVHVEWEVLSGLDKHKATAEAGVGTARQYLDAAYKGLQGKRQRDLPLAVRDLMEECFILCTAPSQDYFDEICKLINLTRTGLNSNDLKLKISNTKSVKSKGVTSTTVGYVRRQEAADSRLASKADWNQGVDTIIHEATHRYAGTADFGEQGYIDSYSASRNFRAPGLTSAQALNNAESYASLVYMAGFYDDWNGAMA